MFFFPPGGISQAYWCGDDGQRAGGGPAGVEQPGGALARIAGPRSGWCTAAKTRAVRRASISCRFTVLYINSWMPMSAVVRGMARSQLISGFLAPVNGAAELGRG
jgi:hypothetical protein